MNAKSADHPDQPVEPESSPQTQPADPGKARSRKWIWIAGGTALLLIVAVGVAPLIVAKTSLRDRIPALALPGYQGELEIGGASLGWFSPTVLTNVTGYDTGGEVLLTIERLEISRSLTDLAMDSSNLGTLTVRRPEVRLVLTEETSNLEQTIAPMLEPSEGPRLVATIIVNDGLVHLRTPDDETAPQLSNLETKITLPPAGQMSSAQVAARAVYREQEGDLTADVKWSPEAIGANQNSLELAAKTDSVPLAAFEAVLVRLGVAVETTGALAGGIRVTTNAMRRTTISFDDLQGQEVVVRSAALLGEDALELDTFTTRGQVSIAGAEIEVRDFELTSPVADFRASGGFDTAQFQEDWRAMLQQRDYSVEGRVDLALLAQKLPKALNVREDLEFNRGTLNLALVSQNQDGQRRWTGHIDTTDISAVRDGQRITWDDPVKVNFTASQLEAGVRIDNLDLSADFLTLHVEGTAAEGSFTADGELERLTENLEQFVDLQSFRLAGKLAADLKWKRSESGDFDATGNASIRNFVLDGDQIDRWQEEEVRLELAADGRAQKADITRLGKLTVRMEAGDDSLQANLREPIDPVTDQSEIPLDVEFVGNLERWHDRVQLLLPGTQSDVRLGGNLAVTSSATVSPQSIEVSDLVATIESLEAVGGGWNVQDPLVAARGSLRYDLLDGTIAVPTMSVEGTAFQAAVQNFQLDADPEGLMLHGTVDVQGELGEITSWTYPPGEAPAMGVQGQLISQVEFRTRGGLVETDVAARLENFTVKRRRPPASADPAALSNQETVLPLWDNAQISLEGRAVYSPAEELLELTDWKMEGPSLALSADGTIRDLSRLDTNIEGQIEYDLQEIAARLQPMFDGQLVLEGSDAHRFRLKGPLIVANDPQLASAAAEDIVRAEGEPESRTTRGGVADSDAPLVPSDLEAEAAFSWDNASWQGIDAGPAALVAKLDQGQLTLNPIDLELNGGRITASPAVLLNRPAPVLTFDEGILIDEVELTPNLCRTWIKYIAPLVAEATEAEGKFSMRTENGLRVPLGGPGAKGAGTLTIHGARVDAGELAEALINVSERIYALVVGTRPANIREINLMTLPEQEVAFRIENGRVYHEGLVMNAYDITIRTTGSVDIERQTLDLIAEVPIRAEWVEGQRVLSAFAGETLRLRVTGDMADPQIDQSDLSDMSTKMVGNAATKLLQQEATRGLFWLLGGREEESDEEEE